MEYYRAETYKQLQALNLLDLVIVRRPASNPNLFGLLLFLLLTLVVSPSGRGRSQYRIFEAFAGTGLLLSIVSG